MLGDAVITYSQMDDVVLGVTQKSTAMRMAEETISLYVESVQRALANDKERGIDLTYGIDNLAFGYSCLADIVRSLETDTDTMVDLDDTCVHYFPAKSCKRLIWLNGSRITTEPSY